MNPQQPNRPLRYFPVAVFEQGYEIGLCLVEFADVVLTRDGVPVAVLTSPDQMPAAAPESTP